MRKCAATWGHSLLMSYFHVNLEQVDSQGEDTEVERIPKVMLNKALQRNHRKVRVSIQNNTNLPVKLKPMLLRQVNTATPVVPSCLVGGAADKISKYRFYF